MKNKISILCLSTLIIFFTSCKKESQVSIVGQWRSVSIYTIQDNGTYNWVQVGGHPLFYDFSAEGKFGSATDIPEASGSYNYDEASGELILHFESGTSWINTRPGPARFKVEVLDRDQLILSDSLPGNRIDKTEYSRVN